MGQRNRRLSALIGSLAAAVLLAGCTLPAPMLQPSDGAEAMPEAPEGLEAFYDQEVAWEDCGEQQCATIEVPLDYQSPDGESIEIALRMAQATDSARGALVINPGGPGGSGVEMVEGIAGVFSPELLAGYDVVGFDPRGVGASSAVACLNSEELDEYYAGRYDLESASGWDEYVEDQAAYGEACLENTGELLEFVDTVSSAQDLDVVRAVLDQPRLDYLGFSYGTFLGATYAELFTENVGRLVLDGGVDPALEYDDMSLGQVAGFDLAYRSYIEDCMAGPECPFDGEVEDAIQDTVDLLAGLSDDPAESGDPDRPATDSDLINTMVIALYSTEMWPVLTEALGALINDGDGETVRLVSDFAMEREDDGTYPEDEGAFRAINCLDYPVELDQDAIEAQAEEIEGLSQVFGPYFGYGAVSCATMPFDARGEPHEITADGAPPILVIGTTRDPATPMEWSESLADQLSSGILISYDGDGHTAYGGSSSCVNELVDGFLLNGDVPAGPQDC